MVIITDTTKDRCPGLHPRRLAALMRDAVERCRLNLTGRVVLTEAASGAYVVTPVLAAMAGAARVHALTRATVYGTVEEVTAQTCELAAEVGVADRIVIATQRSRDIVAEADIVTNSGHVRPIDAEMVAWMKPTAVVPLMYEAWEFRPGDVDLDACRSRGIRIAGTNEQHPAVDVFSFLGIMAVKLLLDAGVPVQGSRLLVLCDNAFGPYIEQGLQRAGANVDMTDRPGSAVGKNGYDAIVVAATPGRQPVVGAANALLSACEISARWPGAVVGQFWGDIDREALAAEKIPYWPLAGVPPGHMGILPAAVGAEPVVRLQCGGLKVGEVLARGVVKPGDADAAFLQIL